jgi:hypothetical protein
MDIKGFAIAIALFFSIFGSLKAHETHVMETETHFITMNDAIPRFAANPNAVAVQSGNWDDPQTWKDGIVPDMGMKVSIPRGIVVKYGLMSLTKLHALEVDGTLEFVTNADTCLFVTHFTVMPHGTFRIGTPESPLPAEHKATVVFNDIPLDLGIDPEQFGNGLINFGKLDLHGAPKTPFSRVAGDLKSGDSSIPVVSTVNGWNPGDIVVIPRTRQKQVYTGVDPILETEAFPIMGSDGNEVGLNGSLMFNHHGCAPNPFAIAKFPHVANITRNIVLTSENPVGVRGHVMTVMSGTFNVTNTSFKSLGRTSAAMRNDNTVMNSDGTASYIGLNQIGRYSCHFHHAMTPFMFDGNVIEDALKWGLVIHFTNNGVVRNSVFYDIDGAAIVAEDGSETGNSFDGNMVVKVDGGYQLEDGRAGVAQMLDSQGKLMTDFGSDGSAFWMRSSEGSYTNNVVYDVAGYCFNFNGYYRGGYLLQQLDMFTRNEGAASFGGLWFSWSQASIRPEKWPRQAIQDFTCWNIQGNGVRTYHEGQLTINNFTLINTPEVSSTNQGSTNFKARRSVGINLDTPTYENYNMKMHNIKISGCNIGVIMPVLAGPEGSLLENAVLKNYVNIGMEKAVDINSAVITGVEYLPSLVARTGTVPEYVADIFHEGLGVIKAGVLDESMPTPLPLSLPVKFLMRDDLLLQLKGTTSGDLVVIRELEDKLEFLIGDTVITFRRSEINSVAFFGYAGDDVFENYSTLPVKVYCGDGNDRAVGGSSDDYLAGEIGDDVLIGGAGSDYIVGGSGNDSIDGEAGIDRLYGNDGNDVIYYETGDAVNGGTGINNLIKR